MAKKPAHLLLVEGVEELCSQGGTPFFVALRGFIVEVLCNIMKGMVIPEEEIPAIISRFEKALPSAIGREKEEIEFLIKELERERGNHENIPDRRSIPKRRFVGREQ